MSHHIKLFSLLAFLCVLQTKTASEIVNLRVQSKIDLLTHFALVRNTITFVNKGPKVIRSYNYVINDTSPFKIVFYNTKGTLLNFQKVPSDVPRFEVELSKDVRANDTFRLICKLTFGQKIVPAMKYRKMEDEQLMRFENNLRFFSQYRTVFCKNEYVLKNESLVEVTEKPTRETNNSVVFLFQNIPKFDSAQVTLVFVNNDAFFLVRSLHRTIDVNHFGKILIRDEVVLQNNGPQFVGPYNTFLLDKKKGVRRSFYTHLPASAENIQVSDILGINTENVVYDFMDYKTLNFKTRYPLVGGWKTSYTLKYKVPIHEYLFTRDRSFVLRIRAIDYIINGEFLNEAVVKVALPEGAKIIKVYRPAILNLEKNELSCCESLCVFGKPTVVLTGKELFEDYVTEMSVEYSLESWKLLRAPLVIIVYLEVIFIVVICGRQYFF